MSLASYRAAPPRAMIASRNIPNQAMIRFYRGSAIGRGEYLRKPGNAAQPNFSLTRPIEPPKSCLGVCFKQWIAPKLPSTQLRLPAKISSFRRFSQGMPECLTKKCPAK
jgi:hypothetical protein